MKRYIVETGTAWVINQVRPSAANDIFVASITGIEITSAITRRVKGKSISQSLADRAIKRFKRNFDKKFIVIDLTPKIIEEGILLAQKYGLRGYDTTQLAVGLNARNRLAKSGVRNFIFISADKDLNIAAQAEGLTVENPNNH
ncbi:MAG: type II toxin-antitoxin system VapC family toxin [Acidobacteriota bacterium]